MSTQPRHLLTPEEYLEIERKAEFKSEYYNGEMFAMSGASWIHNIIVGHLVRVLGQQTLAGPCAVAPSDIRIKVPATGLYTYPDVVTVCGEPKFDDNRQDILLNPTFLAEVLSPLTEAYDRGRKFEHYRSIESLNAYLMIASDRIHADLYMRQPSGEWLLRAIDRSTDTVEIESIGCRFALADVYLKSGLLPPATAD